VSAIQLRQLAEHGGEPGLRDAGLLASALARPRNRLAYGDARADLADLAAAYAFGLVKNHPFVDGNKRTAAVVCETFLEINGHELTAGDKELFQTFVRLAEGTLSEKKLAGWIRSRVRPRG
jgi:death-on-curing protein